MRKVSLGELGDTAARTTPSRPTRTHTHTASGRKAALVPHCSFMLESLGFAGKHTTALPLKAA